MSTSTPARAFPLPTIAEDTLQYAIHPASNSSDQSALALLLTQQVEALLPQPWLWNKDTFELKPSGSHLEGRMRVGDAVDDEWLVVYLLRQISISHPELVISIRDSDGEFLLIEAANDLPGWVTPENAENRLWLKEGGLHLVPLDVRSRGERPKQFVEDDEDGVRGGGEVWINEEDAIRGVRSAKYRDKKLEKAVWERISVYPGALKTHQHHTKAYLPTSIAKALSASPELIQKAVEGFYVRDPSQLRTASRMNQFPPSPAILTPITLTRAAYAQLTGQIFHPPRIFGPEWHVRFPDSDAEEKLEGEKRWRDLGVKIAIGFEIMYKEGGGRRSSRAGGGEVDLEALRRDEGYRNFVKDLKGASYFGQEIEGSEKWKLKEEEAAKGWLKIRAADTAQRPAFAYLVDQAISQSTTPISELETTPEGPEDSDDWLEVSPDELDGMMLKASGVGARAPGVASKDGEREGEGEGSEKMELGDEHGQVLKDLAKRVEDFVGGQGDVEGARFEDELSDDMLGEDSDSEDEEDVEMTPAFKEDRLKTLVPPLNPEEWGQKPLLATSTSTSAVQASTTNSNKSATTSPSKPQAKTNIDESPMKLRAPILAQEEYDGVIPDSDSEDSESETDLPPSTTIPKGKGMTDKKWAGMSASDQLEAYEKGMEEDRRKKMVWDDGIDEAMRRRVWGKDDTSESKLGSGKRIDAVDDEVEGDGEGDIDMGEEEEEFLKFSREALGISDEMWEGILSDRRGRGAFVPKPVDASKNTPAPPKPKVSTKKHEPEPVRTSNVSSVRFGSVAPATPFAPRSRPPPQPREEGGKNMDLDSFDKVMQAMDEELAKARGGPSKSTIPPPNQPNTGPVLPKLPTEEDLEDMSQDDLEAMDRELKAALKGAGIEDEEEDGMDEGIEEVGQLDEDGKREFRMMRDFLESYKSQQGGSGVVGNLFGRLGGS